MPHRDAVMKGIEAIREFFGFGLPSQMPVFETYQRILTDALVLLEEQEAAYQGAEELLQQKTILFEDAIKRLKKQEEEIENLKQTAQSIIEGVCLLKEQEEMPFRCKTCTKHTENGICRKWWQEVKDDDYCSFGERT